jgi:zinc protease
MRALLLALAAVVMFWNATTAHAEVTMETSPGGLSYARVNIPDAVDVSIQIAWPSDWAFREDVNQAVPFIGADLILQGGAEGYPAAIVIEQMADLKIEGLLSVEPGFVFGSLLTPKKNLSEAVKIANAHIRKPALEQKWLDRVKGGLGARNAEANAKAENQGYDALRWAVLGDQPLRDALSALPDERISAVTRADVERWYGQTLLRNTAKIAIAGPVDAKEAGDAIDALFADVSEGKAPGIPSLKVDFSPRRILLHVPDAAFTNLTFLAPLPPIREGGELEDFIIAVALGSDEKSVLFEALRTQLRATYGFFAALGAYSRDVRVFLMTGQVETDKLSVSEPIIRKTYAALRESGPSGDLEQRKEPFVTGFQSNRNNPSTQALAAMIAMLDDQDPAIVLDVRTELEKVTQASIQTRLDKVYPPADGFVLLAVSPDANALPGACVIKTPAEAAGCR